MLKINQNPSLMDQEIEISISNLQPGQRITLHCRTKERKTCFVSHAQFTANMSGDVNLISDASLAGSYTGISSMGIFWSMQPVDDKGVFAPLRYLPKNVLEPKEFILQV